MGGTEFCTTSVKSGIVNQVRDDKRPPPHGKPVWPGAGKPGGKGGKPAGDRPRDQAEIDLARAYAIRAQAEAAERQPRNPQTGNTSATRSAVRQVGPWLLLDTPNFTICSTRELPPADLAAKCEALRKELFEKLGGKAPECWSPRCYVVCHPTEASYARAGRGFARHAVHRRLSRSA